MKMRRVPRGTSVADMQPGDFTWHPPRDETEARRLLVALPVMCDWSQVPGWQDRTVDVWQVSVPVVQGAHGADRWGWDGNISQPSINPSIRVSTEDSDGDRVDVWHGYVTGGELVFVDAHPPKNDGPPTFPNDPPPK